MPPTTSTIAAGAKLGPYEVVALIGAGGMGEVYRAKDTRLGRDVAVKVLPRSFATDPDRLRRFEQEARAAGMLNHPNILAVHDIGTHDGAPYVVSELLEGQTLRDADRRLADAAAQGIRDRGAVRARPRRRTRQGHRPPRPQAGQRLHHPRRTRQDPRLRSRQGCARHERGIRDRDARRNRAGCSRWSPNRSRDGPWHRELHGAGTDPRRAGRSSLRHLRLRPRLLRDADRTPGLPRRLRDRDDERDPQSGSAADGRPRRQSPAGSRAHRPALPREESRGTVPVDSRHRLPSRDDERDVDGARAAGAGVQVASRETARGRRRAARRRRADRIQRQTGITRNNAACIRARDLPARHREPGALHAGRPHDDLFGDLGRYSAVGVLGSAGQSRIAVARRAWRGTVNLQIRRDARDHAGRPAHARTPADRQRSPTRACRGSPRRRLGAERRRHCHSSDCGRPRATAVPDRSRSASSVGWTSAT